MSSETMGYFKSYMLDFGFEQSEVDSYLLNYYIQCESYDSWQTELMIGVILIVIGSAMLILPLLVISDMENLYEANNSSFRSALGEGMLDDDSSYHEK